MIHESDYFNPSILEVVRIMFDAKVWISSEETQKAIGELKTLLPQLAERSFSGVVAGYCETIPVTVETINNEVQAYTFDNTFNNKVTSTMFYVLRSEGKFTIFDSGGRHVYSLLEELGRKVYNTATPPDMTPLEVEYAVACIIMGKASAKVPTAKEVDGIDSKLVKIGNYVMSKIQRGGYYEIVNGVVVFSGIK